MLCKIFAKLTSYLSADWITENQSAEDNSKDLHDFETCLCDRGKKRNDAKKQPDGGGRRS